MAKEKIESPIAKKTQARPREIREKPQKPKTITHPPYFQMIKEALMTLKEKNGSSPYAIAKQIEEKQKSTLPENFRRTLSLQLKNSVAKGKLVKIRASYKLSENTTTSRETRQQHKNKKDEKERKTTRSRKAKKPRQLKSIKSPVSRKALKASAK